MTPRRACQKLRVPRPAPRISFTGGRRGLLFLCWTQAHSKDALFSCWRGSNCYGWSNQQERVSRRQVSRIPLTVSPKPNRGRGLILSFAPSTTFLSAVGPAVGVHPLRAFVLPPVTCLRALGVLRTQAYTQNGAERGHLSGETGHGHFHRNTCRSRNPRRPL